MTAAPQSIQPMPETVRQISMGSIVRFDELTQGNFEPDDEALIFLNDDNEQTCHVRGPNAKAMAAQIVAAVNSHTSLKARIQELENTIDRADAHTAGLMDSIGSLETRLRAADFAARTNYAGWKQEVERNGGSMP